jgi:hypothetical protein
MTITSKLAAVTTVALLAASGVAAAAHADAPARSDRAGRHAPTDGPSCRCR